MHAVQAAQHWLPQPQTAHCRAADTLLAGGGPSRVISKDEVAGHDSMETGVWVTHKARDCRALLAHRACSEPASTRVVD